MAQAPLLTGFGGRAGYGPECLGMNDDGSSNRLRIDGIFPSGLRFFSMTHTSLFVNTNGNITFSDPLPTFTPDAFPVAARPMIAPFWAERDAEHPFECAAISSAARRGRLSKGARSGLVVRS